MQKINVNSFVEEFLEELNNDKTSDRSPGNRIVKVLMNTKDNQGTITIVPFMNKKTNNFYLKLSNVKEWNGHTTKFDVGQVWYKILPDDCYENLSQENQDLLSEINGLYDSIYEYKSDDFNTIRYRNYSLIYGVLLSHKNTDGKELDNNINRPCLFIFPSHSPINALHTAVGVQCQGLKGSKDWITDIFSPNNTGRDGVMFIDFKKSKNPGYDSSITFGLNSNRYIYIDSTRVFEEEVIKFFNDPIRDFLGWQGDGENGYFNVEIMKELRDDLKLEFKKFQAEQQGSIKPEQVYENKNGQQDPMKNVSQVTVSSNVPVYDTENNKSTDLPF